MKRLGRNLGLRSPAVGLRTPAAGRRTPVTGRRTPDFCHRPPDPGLWPPPAAGHRPPDFGHRNFPDRRIPVTGFSPSSRRDEYRRDVLDVAGGSFATSSPEKDNTGDDDKVWRAAQRFGSATRVG
ncbi:hypothetical protein ACLB2K_022401 [Fragaria x ananassa]